jgi:hypothetical protein
LNGKKDYFYPKGSLLLSINESKLKTEVQIYRFLDNFYKDNKLTLITLNNNLKFDTILIFKKEIH